MRVIFSVALLAASGSAFSVGPINKRPAVALNALELDTSQIAAGAAAIALVGAGAFAVTSRTAEPAIPIPEPEPEPPVDVSIPYDSAALLAYDAWRTEGDRGDFEQGSYDKFKTAYNKMTVAMVTFKKAKRDMDLL